MKNFLLILLAAVVGGFAALGGAQFLGLNQETKYVEVQAPLATNYAEFAEPSKTVNVNPAPSAGFATAAEIMQMFKISTQCSQSNTDGRMNTAGSQVLQEEHSAIFYRP